MIKILIHSWFWYDFVNMKIQFLQLLWFLKSCIITKICFIGKTTKLWYKFVRLWDKNHFCWYLYIKIIWYAPLLFQFNWIAYAFCLLFRGKWHTHELLLAAKLSQKSYPSTTTTNGLLFIFTISSQIQIINGW